MRIADALESFDFLGTPIQLNFNGQDTIKSKLGTFASIVINLLFLAYAIKRGQELIFHVGPTVV